MDKELLGTKYAFDFWKALKKPEEREPTFPIEKRVHYVSGHIHFPYRSPGIIFITPDLVEFRAFDFVMHPYHFRFPTQKLKLVDIKTTKEITAWRVFLAGPLLGAFFKKETKLVVVQYEDELGLIQTLLFETLNEKDDREKIELVRDFRDALAESRKK